MAGAIPRGANQRAARSLVPAHRLARVTPAAQLARIATLRRQRWSIPRMAAARAVAWLVRARVRVERVMTDNGSAYRSHAFAGTCQRLGLRHLRTRPYTPRTNGKAERFIQTLLREWASVQPYQTSRARRRTLSSWLHYYNCHRAHRGLRGAVPIRRLPAGYNLVGIHN